MRELTIDDLIRFMRECAGEDETVDLDGDILDAPFGHLGYDSLALLETAARIEHEFNISLPDEMITEIETPRVFLDFVNGRLTV